MTEQKNAPAAAAARGTHKITITEKYTPIPESLQAKIMDKLNRITDIHALNRIYDCVYRKFLKAGTETTKDFTSATLKIDDGVTALEIAAEAYEVLSDAVESEFNYVPDNPTEEAFLNRLNMYFSAFSLFQEKLQGALGKLQAGKDELLSIKKGRCRP